MKPLVLVSIVCLLLAACSARKERDATQIHGVGERFHAITVQSNNFEATSIYKSGTHGQPIWTEWDLDRDGQADMTTFSYGGKNIASVYTSSNKPPGFDFIFYGSDGKVRTHWIARPGSDTFTDRIIYRRGGPLLEILVDGKWEAVVERSNQKGILSHDQWFPLSYTNGSWTITPTGGKDE